jgi:hypothetical protein
LRREGAIINPMAPVVARTPGHGGREPSGWGDRTAGGRRMGTVGGGGKKPVRSREKFRWIFPRICPGMADSGRFKAGRRNLGERDTSPLPPGPPPTRRIREP